ncbi:Midasin [Bienertia sinuspersici]
MDPKLLETFTCNDGYSTSKGAFAYLDDKNYDIGHRYILGNCEFLKDFERLFEEHVIRTYGCINAQDVWTTYDHNFSSWFKGHDPHDYAILDEEEEVAVEEDEFEEDEDEDKDEDEDEDEDEEEEEEGEGEDDEEEEDNNDDGGAADDLDGIMTYRSRGGLNRRGGIIRPRPKVAEARVSTELETTSHGVRNQNRQQQQQQHVLATVTEQPIEGSEDNQNHQSETHIANDDTLGHEDVNVGQGITVSDDTCNPEAKFCLHPDGLWFGYRKVLDAVVETSYKTYFKGPYYNWGVTLAEVKDRWWNAFKAGWQGLGMVAGWSGERGAVHGVLGARGCPTGGLGVIQGLGGAGGWVGWQGLGVAGRGSGWWLGGLAGPGAGGWTGVF